MSVKDFYIGIDKLATAKTKSEEDLSALISRQALAMVSLEVAEVTQKAAQELEMELIAKNILSKVAEIALFAKMLRIALQP